MYLKALTIALLGTLAYPGTGHAQVLLGILFGDKLSSDRFHIGMTVGPNLANVSGIDGTSLRPGLLLGLLGEWRVAGDFYLQPELLPFYRVGAESMPLSELRPPLDSVVTGRSAQRDLSYFEIPVIAKYRVAGSRLHLGAGPQVGFLTSATDKAEGTIDRAITLEDDIKDALSSTDAGVVFHVEFKLAPDAFATSFAARYYLGLTDLVRDNPGRAQYNRVLSIVASIAMGGEEDGEEEDGR